MMDCHMIVEVRSAFLPKRRYNTIGEAFMKASTIGLRRPKVSGVHTWNAFWTHGWSESDEQIDLVVQLRMNRQRRKSLSCPLTEADIT